jgi:hypothetical protein
MKGDTPGNKGPTMVAEGDQREGSGASGLVIEAEQQLAGSGDCFAQRQNARIASEAEPRLMRR